MRNIKLTIQYDGTGYCGWQSQINAVSVQDVLEKALAHIIGEDIRITGSGRTDSGVHARGQVANFHTLSAIPLGKLKLAMNSKLPREILVCGAKDVNGDFNARHDAKSKIYRYAIYNGYDVSPFLARYVYAFFERLDAGKMKEAAGYFRGRHDFKGFMGTKTSVKTTTRTVKSILVRKKGRLIEIDIEADGFLYNMARAICGALIECGRGKITPLEVKAMIGNSKRSLRSPTVPAKGLTLLKVKY